MGGWLVGWMDGWMDGWMNGWMDVKTSFIYLAILSCTSPDVVLCKVTYKIERDTSFNRKEGGVSEPPIRFFQITLSVKDVFVCYS